MENYRMSCRAIAVRTESGVCPGEARTKKDEEYILSARTPEHQGICINALCAIHPMSFAMRMTRRLHWEDRDFVDLTCPHGAVTFRIARIPDDGQEAQ